MITTLVHYARFCHCVSAIMNLLARSVTYLAKLIKFRIVYVSNIKDKSLTYRVVTGPMLVVSGSNDNSMKFILITLLISLHFLTTMSSIQTQIQ